MYGDVMDGNGSDLVHDCVDRHVEAGLGARVAIHFEGGPGGGRSLTYARLQDEVARAADALSGLGVGAGDRVTLRAAATPEAVVALLACARVGADPSVSPGPPEAAAPAAGVEDIDDALAVRRRERAGRPAAGSDACRCGGGTEVEPVAEERAADGTLGGVSQARSLRVRRTCRCRFELGATARRNLGLGDLDPDPAHRRAGRAAPAAVAPPGAYGPARHGSETDVYWSRVTEGWGSGLPAGVRGPLTAGATQVIHAGTPATLHEEELWATVQKYRVSVLYTTPEDIRTLMLWGDEIATRHDLSSLCVLGTVGARSGTEGWIWYRDPAEDAPAGAGGEPGRWELRTCSTPWAVPTPERRGRNRLYVVR